MKKVTLDPIAPEISIIQKDELEIHVKRDYVYFYPEIDQVGATFRISKKELEAMLK